MASKLYALQDTVTGEILVADNGYVWASAFTAKTKYNHFVRYSRASEAFSKQTRVIVIEVTVHAS